MVCWKVLLDLPFLTEAAPEAPPLKKELSVISAPANYVERSFAPLQDIMSILRTYNVCLIGPVLCGKTTTLKALCAKMNSEEGKEVGFIDMKAIPPELLNCLQPSTTITYFIDNAQLLAQDSLISRRVKFLLQSTSANCCFSFSPVLPGFHGDAVICSGIRPVHYVHFTPFSEDEFSRFKCKSARTFHNDFQPESAAYIPGVLADVTTNEEAEYALSLNAGQQFDKITRGITSEVRADRTLRVHLALRKLANYGCNSLLYLERVLLVRTGFCWTTDPKISTIQGVFPIHILRNELSHYDDTVKAQLRTFNTGAALEYEFLTIVRQGTIAKCMNDNEEEVTIPSSLQDVWMQDDFGTVPTKATGCLIMKLAENHCAVDFLILDSTKIGTAGKRLYFVQVSALAYTDWPTNRRYNAIHTTFSQLDNQTPFDCYSQKLNVETNNCYFIYATTSSSTRCSESGKVYKVQL